MGTMSLSAAPPANFSAAVLDDVGADRSRERMMSMSCMVNGGRQRG